MDQPITLPASLSAAFAPGEVALVGAGPGDPGLLTLRAWSLLQQADAVVYDRLVSDGLLALLPATCSRHYVGKTSGYHSLPQPEINALLAELALQNKRVVRLKGGDPFIFGRGGEEVEHLRAAGVPVQVVNGITAGLAGMTQLGAPLTHREHAHGVVFITGHNKPGNQGTDWRQLAATARDARLTLVIYMGVTGCAHIQEELLTGLPAHTPAVVIQHVSLPQQRHAVTTLGQLQSTITREGLASPSVIVIGDVVRGIQAVAHGEDAAPVAGTRSRAV